MEVRGTDHSASLWCPSGNAAEKELFTVCVQTHTQTLHSSLAKSGSLNKLELASSPQGQSKTKNAVVLVADTKIGTSFTL